VRAVHGDHGRVLWAMFQWMFMIPSGGASAYLCSAFCVARP
jgi:hypothetical protein